MGKVLTPPELEARAVNVRKFMADSSKVEHMNEELGEFLTVFAEQGIVPKLTDAFRTGYAAGWLQAHDEEDNDGPEETPSSDGPLLGPTPPPIHDKHVVPVDNVPFIM